MIRSAKLPTAFLVFALATAAGWSAPLPPDRQWGAGDMGQEEERLRENLAKNLDEMAEVVLLLKYYFKQTEDELGGQKANLQKLRAVRVKLRGACRALEDSAAHSRRLKRQREHRPNHRGQRFEESTARPLTRLADVDLPLMEGALADAQAELEKDREQDAVVWQTLQGLQGVIVEIGEARKAIVEREEVESQDAGGDETGRAQTCGDRSVRQPPTALTAQ